MINPAAVKAYINEKKDTYAWIKNAPEEELWDAINALEPRPEFHTEPFHHQLVCFYIGVVVPTFAFFLEMRLGKTKVILDIHTYRARLQKESYRTLVLVPQLIHFESWIKNAQEHAPYLKVCAMEGSSKERWEEFEDPQHDVYVLNYQGFYQMLSDLETTEKGKKKLKMNRMQTNEFAGLFSMAVCDESTAIKNHSSLSFKVARRLSQSIPNRFCLTGTPHGRSPIDLWSQFYFLDHGEALGKTIGLFREVFFTKKKTYWAVEYNFNDRRLPLLIEKMAGRSITYKANECLDMPKVLSIPVYVHWDAEARVMYSRTHEQYAASARQAQERENNFIKLRQISAGFLRYKDPETDEKVDLVFSKNPKLDALLELVRQAPPDAKFVVFHFFVPVGALISAALKKEKVKHVRVWGEATDKRGLLRKFQDDPLIRVLVINETMGAMALDLQVAGYIVFYESPTSPITRAQAEARCSSPNKKGSIFIHDLIIRNSVDERVLSFIREGLDIRDELMKGSVDLSDSE